MKFGIHKCAYWGRKFRRDKGQEITLEDFKLCGKVILKHERYEAFKYLGEQKAPVLSITNKKPVLPRTQDEAREGKKAFRKYEARVAQLETPRIRKLHYARKLDFLSQAARPLIEILCPMTHLSITYSIKPQVHNMEQHGKF